MTELRIAGIAPYNGVVAVTQNSRVLSAKEHEEDPAYPAAQKACEHVAALCQATAPIRIDCRRPGDKGPILLFDVNMKPVRIPPPPYTPKLRLLRTRQDPVVQAANNRLL